MRISIRPVGEVPRDVLEDLAVDLAALGEATVLDPAPVDPSWLDTGRDQYQAGKILDAIEGDAGHRVLAVTPVDLYSGHANLNFVFGQARTYGREAVVSTARLGHPDPRKARERLAKEAVHELGHTLGLDHCTNRECVMAFSNSLDGVDRKAALFCSRCRVTVDFVSKRLRS